MKVLVTGATGMVGSELTRLLLKGGDDVRILHRPTSSLATLGDARGHVETVVGDITEPATLEPAFVGVDLVYHVAAYIGLGSRRERRRLQAVNVRGTAAVVDAALRAGVKRLVHTSSIAAIGRPEVDRVTIDESHEWHGSRGNSYYARSKHQAELEVQRGIAEGLDAVLVNPSMIFGIGRPGENTRLLVDRIRKQQMPVAPRGATNFVDAQDVARGHIRAMEAGITGERYILGGENLAWREALSILADAFDVRPPRFVASPGLAVSVGWILEGLSYVLPMNRVVTRETARTASQTYAYDNRKAREELGCTFRPFRETAERIARIVGRGRETVRRY